MEVSTRTVTSAAVDHVDVVGNNAIHPAARIIVLRMAYFLSAGVESPGSRTFAQTLENEKREGKAILILASDRLKARLRTL